MTHGLITLDWADGAYSFRLAYGQWLELQDAAGVGALELYKILVQGRWRVQQIREVIRMGLIGGGQTPANALRLVRQYVEERPILESVGLAASIVAASISVPEGETASGEAEAPGTGSSESTSAHSTGTVQ